MKRGVHFSVATPHRDHRVHRPAVRTHARKLIADFVDYYDEDRCHLSLNKDSPKPRPVLPRPSPTPKVVAIQRVGGIRHRYEWRDAA